MIRGEFADAGERSAEELREAYESVLREAISRVGVERVTDETDVNPETVAALADGESPEVTVEEAAAVLALEEGRPAAETLAADARDLLLMGMTTAVLDVEALSSGVDAAMEPKEIQQKLEGRYPMTLGEYATIHQYVAARSA